MRVTATLVATAALAAGLAGVAQAQFAKPENAIKYRQSTMYVQGTHFGRIGAVVKGERPFNKDEVLANAMIVEEMSKLHWQAFGSGTDKGAETRALAAIWKEPAKFEANQKKLMEGTAKLVSAAQSGDLGNVKTAFGAVGQACKACHDDFRKE